MAFYHAENCESKKVARVGAFHFRGQGALHAHPPLPLRPPTPPAKNLRDGRPTPSTPFGGASRSGRWRVGPSDVLLGRSFLECGFGRATVTLLESSCSKVRSQGSTRDGRGHTQADRPHAPQFGMHPARAAIPPRPLFKRSHSALYPPVSRPGTGRDGLPHRQNDNGRPPGNRCARQGRSVHSRRTGARNASRRPHVASP